MSPSTSVSSCNSNVYLQWIEANSKNYCSQMQREKTAWGRFPNQNEELAAYMEAQGHLFPKIQAVVAKITYYPVDYVLKNCNSKTQRIFFLFQVPTILITILQLFYLTLDLLHLLKYVVLFAARIAIFVLGGFLVSEARQALLISIKMLLLKIVLIPFDLLFSVIATIEISMKSLISVFYLPAFTSPSSLTTPSTQIFQSLLAFKNWVKVMPSVQQ